MSRPIKVASIDELKSRKKARKIKIKEPEVEVPKLQQAVSTDTSKAKVVSTETTAKGMKRKIVEEDTGDIIVRIPTGSTAISDPSSLNPFIKKLLLEEDDERLSKIGPVETMRKAAVLSYQVSRLNNLRKLSNALTKYTYLYLFIFF